MATTLSGLSSLGTGLTYLWTTSNGSILSGNTSSIVTINSAGTYNLQVTDVNGVSDNVDYVVTAVSNAPSVSITTNTGNNSLSGGGGTLTLTGTTDIGTSFKWKNSEGQTVSITNTLDVTEIGVYTLEVTKLYQATQGCYIWTLFGNYDIPQGTDVRVRYKDCNNETQEIRQGAGGVSFCSYYPIEVDLNDQGYQGGITIGTNQGIYGSLSGGTSEGNCITETLGCTGSTTITITA